MSADDQLRQTLSLTTELLAALRPWDAQPREVRELCFRLTVALAALPAQGFEA